MPKGQLSILKDQPTCRCYSMTRVTEFYGCIFGIQSNFHAPIRGGFIAMELTLLVGKTQGLHIKDWLTGYLPTSLVK